MPQSCARVEASMAMRMVFSGCVLAVFCCVTLFYAVAVGADSRFIDNGDGTVTDTATGLMWAQTDNLGNISWDNSKLYCENIILSRYTDWRMPTIDELKTLFDRSLPGYETICGQKVRSSPQVQLSCGNVWSSEILPVPGGYIVSAYAFNFSRGYQYSARMTQYRGFRALPVRTVK